MRPRFLYTPWCLILILLLSEIPERAKYFSVIDSKDAFYSVPLAQESQFLFVFEDPTQPASQLTWTVLPQGFRDSPHLFGQSLSRDLQNFNSSEAVVLQYVDDILLCAETEEACSRASEDFLNFLAGCGYKASREKAQLCQQSVRYLGLIISEGTRAIGPERIKPILNHPLPMTLRQLRGFLGITGYCRIWIPGYGELARPLYKLIAETQQAQTDKLVWSPETQKAFKVLQTALLQAPALSLPTGSEFNLFVTERKGVALGVLTQPRGPHQQPIAYLSRELDVVSRGWPHCLRVIGAAALLAPEALKIING